MYFAKKNCTKKADARQEKNFLNKYKQLQQLQESKNRLDKKYEKWDEKRERTQRIEEMFQGIIESPLFCSIGPAKKKKLRSRYLRMCQCTVWLEFTVNQSNGKTYRSLSKTNFCRDRLCPVCQWRRSQNMRDRVWRVLTEFQMKQKDLRYIFLTLTMRNCKVNELKSTISLMNKAFTKITKRKKFKDTIKGHLKTVEITRNKKNNTAHPHFHILLVVDENYFKKARRREDKSGYFTQAELTELWRHSLGINYKPEVDIRAVKRDEKLFSVMEITKYMTKTEDLTADRGWFLEYMFQIENLRFFTSGGILKKALSELDKNLLETEKKQPVDVEDEGKNEKEYFTYNRQKRFYVRGEKES